MEQDSFTISPGVLQDLSFIELVVAVVIGWLLVDIWVRFVENFAYQTLGLNEKSAYHSFVVAFVVTLIFIAVVFVFRNISGNANKRIVSESFEPFSKNGYDFMDKIVGMI